MGDDFDRALRQLAFAGGAFSVDIPNFARSQGGRDARLFVKSGDELGDLVFVLTPVTRYVMESRRPEAADLMFEKVRVLVTFVEKTFGNGVRD